MMDSLIQNTGVLLAYMGINPPNALAGYLGSLVYVYFARKTEPVDALGFAIIGTILANYFGETAAFYTKDYHITGLAPACMVGAAGNLIVQSGIAFLKKVLIWADKKWSPQ